MTDPVLEILYGPPGTGKTWQATRRAVRLIDSAVAENKITDRHRSLVASGQIVWVTFHPSYTYEDFVEGFRPEVNEKGIMYAPRPGPFRIACNNVTLESPAAQVFFVGQKLTSSTGNEYEVIVAASDSVVLKNVKGKGLGLHTPVSFHVIERLRGLGYKPGDLSLPGTAHAEKVTIAERAGYDMQTLFGMTGPLRATWEYLNSTSSISETRRAVVLVIDELNRADLSRVFGDMITLLEADKRLGALEEKKVMLPYSKTIFGVPQELHIVATMNTADRSLSTMDLALRRRFDFIEVAPSSARCAVPYAGVSLPEIHSGWNQAISVLSGRDKQIGHAYLERPKLEAIRIRNGFSPDAGGELKATAVLLRKNVIPLLLDIFKGDWRRVNFVLGSRLDQTNETMLRGADMSALRSRAGEEIDLEASNDYTFSGWCDPQSTEWSDTRFRQAIMSAAAD